MCLGECPVYEVVVWGSGKVEYHGEHFVAEEGDRSWTITKRRLTALAKAIEKVNYFEMSWEDLGSYATDHPSAITSVEFRDGRSRTINHDYGGYSVPEELTKLEATIDRLAGTAPYTKDVNVGR